MSNVGRVAAQAANTLTTPLNVEDVFSTYLYTGTGSAQTITNGIDLSGEGGLVWTKSRQAGGNYLTDTVRGAGALISTNSTDAQSYTADTQKTITSFNADGYSLGTDTGNWGHNFSSAYTYASWTFRKAPKFFDVQTFTTTYNNNPNVISHNLESDLGCAIFKQLNSTGQGYNWIVWHRSLGLNKYLILNGTNSQTSDTNSIKAVDNSAGTISFGYPMSNVADRLVSGSTETTSWVGYFFAHNNGDGNFGPTKDQDIIKCGSWTASSTSAVSVDLGFEPQWVLVKRANGGTQSWLLWDTMRGMPVDTGQPYLQPNLSSAESTDTYYLSPTPTGFTVRQNALGSNGDTYIYIAIRRGPMAVPESATDVFHANKFTTTGFTEYTGVGFAPDLAVQKAVSSADNWEVVDKLRGPHVTLKFNATDAQSAADAQYYLGGFLNDGVKMGSASNGQFNGWNPNLHYYWKRAPSFFDAVAYTGNGVAGRTVSHNLGVAPEMIWVKQRNVSRNWVVYNETLGAGKYLKLNDINATITNTQRFDTAPTEAVFTVGNDTEVNGSGGTYIAYLFASLAGVSKVGSLSHTIGSNTTVDCGFSSGARFVLLKLADGTENWLMFDTARGLTSSTAPALFLNLTNAEYDQNQVDPDSSGFIMKSGYFTSGTYIFYAIA